MFQGDITKEYIKVSQSGTNKIKRNLAQATFFQKYKYIKRKALSKKLRILAKCVCQTGAGEYMFQIKLLHMNE